MSMISGLSAALSLVGKENDALKLIKDVNKKRRLSFVNRLLYERLNDRQIASITKKLANIEDPLSILSEAYKWNIKNFMRWKNLDKRYEVRTT